MEMYLDEILAMPGCERLRETIPAAIFMLPTDATLEQVAAAWDGPSSIAPKPLKR